MSIGVRLAILAVAIGLGVAWVSLASEESANEIRALLRALLRALF